MGVNVTLPYRSAEQRPLTMILTSFNLLSAFFSLSIALLFLSLLHISKILSSSVMVIVRFGDA